MTGSAARLSLCALLVGIATRGRASAQAPPLGPEFQVEAESTEEARHPAVAALPDGGFVVAWSVFEDGALKILGQRFDGLGSKKGGEFAVSPPTAALAEYPAVASDAGGNFLVVWNDADGSGSGVFGQRFDAAGGKVGPEFPVNTYTTGFQNKPQVAMNGEGRFVVVWKSYFQDGSGTGIFGQRFDPSGARAGLEFAVPTNTLDSQDQPTVGMDRSGNFVVLWSGLDLVGPDVFGQRFASDGRKTGIEFRIRPFGGPIRSEPAVAGQPAGDFLVAWSVGYTVVNEVDAQLFDVSGERVGGQILVQSSSGPIGGATLSPIAGFPGGFLAAWREGANVGARLLDRVGQQRAPEFSMAHDAATLDRSAHAAATAAGPAAVWMTGSDADTHVHARRQVLTPVSLGVDERSGAAASSDRNGVLEEGEASVVEPAWTNHDAGAAPLSGTVPTLAPCLPSHACLTAVDGEADYGSLAPGASSNCAADVSNPCFAFQLSGPRPSAHWDEQFTETLSTGATQTWTVHVGESFADVPRAEPFYRKIEALFHSGLTSGCSPTAYCPAAPVPRDQMAIFVAKAVAGAGILVPTAGVVASAPYSCTNGGASLFADVAPTDLACRHVHYLASQNVTLGCSPAQYCPAQPMTRDVMASLIAKAIVAPGGGDAVPAAYGPDAATGRSYSCAAGSPHVHFADVPPAGAFCKHIHYLWAKGIVDGCAATKYCPSAAVQRDAMAKFLVNAFGLAENGP